jgi:hypothetical protein
VVGSSYTYSYIAPHRSEEGYWTITSQHAFLWSTYRDAEAASVKFEDAQTITDEAILALEDISAQLDDLPPVRLARAKAKLVEARSLVVDVLADLSEPSARWSSMCWLT